MSITFNFSINFLYLKAESALKPKAEAVLEALADLFLTEGIPEYIRSNNGSEFVAKNVQAFLQKLQVTTA